MTTQRLPTGNVTFLFTDIEGSTTLLQNLGDRFNEVLDEHHRLLRAELVAGNGIEVSTEGDAFFVVFPSAADAVRTAAEMQRSLSRHTWPEGIEVRVRMGLHTGEAVLVGDNYGGIDVHRTARIASAAHGGQIVISEATRALVVDVVGDGVKIKDLGVHRLKDLTRREHLFQLRVQGLQDEFPALRTLDARPNNLPRQLAPFVARDRELDEIEVLLREHHLVTLTGPGGTGKTRLSLEVATRSLDSFTDGVFVVFMAALNDPALVPSAIAEALRIREESTRPISDSLVEFLSTRSTLLVLDNLEQLLAAGAYVSRLLSASPALKVLATTRAPLRISGEQEYPVPAMTTPDPLHLPPPDLLASYEAVDLFVQRARAVKPTFDLTDENADVVAKICWRLDGLPLAIELAAARLRVFSPHDLLRRLDQSLSVLTGGARDLPARQQTLRGAIEWSYALLDEPVRAFFRCLGVFSGGWTLDAAEAVANPGDEIVDTVEALELVVENSLVRRYETDAGGTRYRMLQTIREFALDSSGDEEREQTEERLARFCHRLAADSAPLILQDRAALEELAEDHDNMRTSLAWSVKRGAADIGLELAASLWRFWQLRSHLEEGRRWLEDLLELPGAATRDAVRAKGLMAAGSITYWQNDFPATRLYYEQALEIFREIGDPNGTMDALYNNGFVGLIEHRVSEAERFYEESLELARELGNKEAEANAQWGLAMAALQDRDYERAERLAQICLEIFDELGNWWGRQMTDFVFYQSARLRGDLERARARVLKALEEMGGDQVAASYQGGIEFIADVLVGLGAPEQAVVLGGAAAKMKAAYGGGSPPPLLELSDIRERVRGLLSEERITELFEEGQSMSAAEAIALAFKDPDTS